MELGVLNRLPLEHLDPYVGVSKRFSSKRDPLPLGTAQALLFKVSLFLNLFSPSLLENRLDPIPDQNLPLRPSRRSEQVSH